MIIAMAQVAPEFTDVEKNLILHHRLIDQAIEADVDLIVFPELSLSGYAPQQATELATKIKDANYLSSLQDKAASGGITIAVGVPTQGEKGTRISLIFIQPNQQFIAYSKQFLHLSEQSYFEPGEKSLVLSIAGENVAFAICYELKVEQHLAQVMMDSPSLYVASIACSASGLSDDYNRLSQIAQEQKIPVMMVNSIGCCGDFDSAGNSAMWNRKGEIVAQLDRVEQGLIIHNTLTQQIITSAPERFNGCE